MLLQATNSLHCGRTGTPVGESLQGRGRSSTRVRLDAVRWPFSHRHSSCPFPDPSLPIPQCLAIGSTTPRQVWPCIPPAPPAPLAPVPAEGCGDGGVGMWWWVDLAGDGGDDTIVLGNDIVLLQVRPGSGQMGQGSPTTGVVLRADTAPQMKRSAHGPNIAFGGLVGIVRLNSFGAICDIHWTEQATPSNMATVRSGL